MKLYFFIKQKTAYEVLRSLVGSEMCIRDSSEPQTVTQLLHGARNGDREALDQLLPMVYAELHLSLIHI